jgi:hypothetical protein
VDIARKDVSSTRYGSDAAAYQSSLDGRIRDLASPGSEVIACSPRQYNVQHRYLGDAI